MARDVAEERLHHDPAEHERDDEADGDEREPVGAQIVAALPQIEREGARHGRHGEPERELGRRAPVGAEQHGRHDGRAGARHARDHRQALEHADQEIHRHREGDHVAVARLELEALDPDERDAADDERDAHDPRVEQHGLDEVVQQRAEHRGRQEREQDADHEAARRRVDEEADRKPDDAHEIDRQQREDCAELDQDRKGVAEVLVAEAEEMLHQQQMSSRRHREVLGEPFDHAENGRLDEVEHRVCVSAA